MTGKTVSGYTIKKLIGSGGMAEVYYAENGLGKAAAVKVLLKKYSEDTAVRERFELEARVMVKLDHPHIRKVFDMGELDQRPAIIMEYLEGNTLKEALDSKSKPTDEQLRRYFDQCCEALAYTHSKGIVHRDIKPSNLFITRQDEIKILDFGIAKTRESVSNTLTGQTLGTILYMSPEQVKDPKRVDEKTDVYSLGVSFYHAVTGRAPYETSTDSSFEIQSKIVNDSLDFTILPPHWQLKLRPYLEKEKWQRPDLSIFRKTSQVDLDEITVINSPVTSQKTTSEKFTKYKLIKITAITSITILAIVGIWYLNKDKLIYLKQIIETVSDDNADEWDTPVEYNDTTGEYTDYKCKPIQYKADDYEISQVVNEIRRNMVTLPSGDFMMGPSSIEPFIYEVYKNEMPTHKVKMKRFLINKFEITQKQFGTIMGFIPEDTKKCENCPIDNISWEDAQEFIRQLNKISGEKYRLPTEKEWEYAASGGVSKEDTLYYIAFSGENDYFTLDSLAWYSENSEGMSHRVGSKKPNGYGLFDMSGNVWEWCSNWYKAYPGNYELDDGAGSFRVLRGGSYDSKENFCRISFRNFARPIRCYGPFGVRLASSE